MKMVAAAKLKKLKKMQKTVDRTVKIAKNYLEFNKRGI